MIARQLIAVEGGDAAGKTTLIDRLAIDLRGTAVAPQLLVTDQPSDGPIGMLIRSMLRGPAQAVDVVAMQMLFTADRIDQAARVVGPTLRDGGTVISSRSEMSTAVYLAAQESIYVCRDCGEECDELRGDTHNWDHRALATMNEALTWNARVPHPGLVLVLATDSAVAERRRRERGTPELFDDAAMQARVGILYRDHAPYVMHMLGCNVCVVPHAEPYDSVRARVTDYLTRLRGCR